MQRQYRETDSEDEEESRPDPAAAWRCQFGLNLRKAVSKLPRLTCLTLADVSFEEPSADVVALHPYSKLKWVVPLSIFNSLL